MGNVADAVRRAGGSLARVFRRAELPMRLIERPDQLMLLRDQLALIEYAVEEVGDPLLAPRLSLQAGFRGLGPFAGYVAAARTLEQAVLRCNAGIGPLLQSATHMDIQVGSGVARWRYRVTDPVTVGRRHNEMLALGYMVDVLRHFDGPHAAPMRATLPGHVDGRPALQDLLGCEVITGDCAALEFEVSRLALRHPSVCTDPAWSPGSMPDATDFLGGVAQLIRLALLEERPTIAWMARRLGLTRRTLQRRLRDEGSSFEALRERELMHRAAELLGSSRLSISEIALELGYSGPAQFTRAATRWSGAPPRAWRDALRDAPRGATCKDSRPGRA